MEGAGKRGRLDPVADPDEPDRAPRPTRSSRGRSSTRGSRRPPRTTWPASWSVAGGRRRLRSAACPRPLLALVGPTASGKTEAGVALARGARRRDRLASTRCSSTAGWTSAPPSPRRGARRASRTTCSTSPSRPSRSPSRATRRAARDARRARSTRAGAAPLLVGGSGLYFRAVVDDLEFPGTDAATRADLEREADGARGRARCTERLASIGPGRRREDRARQRAPDGPRARGGGRHRPARSRRSPTAWERYDPRADARRRGSRCTREVLAAPDPPARRTRCSSADCSRRSGPSSSAGSAAGSPRRQAIGYAEMARHLQGSCSLDGRVGGHRAADRRTSRGGRWRGSAGTRASGGSTGGRGRWRSTRSERAPRGAGGRDDATSCGSPSTRAPGNDFVMVVDLDDERPLTADEVAALCDRRSGVGADGLIRLVRSARPTRRSSWTTATPTAASRRCAATACGASRALARDAGLDRHGRPSTWRPGRHPTARAARGRSDGRIASPSRWASRRSRSPPIPMRGPAWETFLAEPFDIGGGHRRSRRARCRWATRTSSCSSRTTPTASTSRHIGPALEHHELFPEGTNVEFAHVLERRDHRRACGSGARGRPWRAAAARARSRSPRTRPGSRRRERSCGSPAATSRSSAARTARSLLTGAAAARVRGLRGPRPLRARPRVSDRTALDPERLALAPHARRSWTSPR